MAKFIVSEKGAIKTYMVDPSMCEGSDIELFNRARESWSLDDIIDLQESIRKFGVQIPAIGYLEGGRTKIVKGNQRRKIVQAFQANKEKVNLLGTGGKGEAPMLPVTYINKPKTEEELLNTLLGMIDENNVRYGDDALTLFQSFKMLRDKGMTLEQIGERCYCSHAKVDYYLRAFSNKATADEVIKGHLDVKAAADITRSKAVQVTDPKTGKKKLDEVKIKEAIKEAKQAAQATGKKPGKKLGIKDVKDRKPQSNTRDAGEIKRILKTIVELPTDSELLPEIRWFAKWLLTKLTSEALKNAIKRNKLDLEALLELIAAGAFEPKKKAAKKAEKTATKKAAGKASKKANPMIEEEDDEEEDDDLDAGEYED